MFQKLLQKIFDKCYTPHRECGQFEKVSFYEFSKAITTTFGGLKETNKQPQSLIGLYEDLEKPKRATTDSAGYDFKAPIGFVLEVGQTAKIPTGIRVKMDKGWFLGGFVRSSMGFKYRLQLDNGTMIIDGDYYYSDNEGHIYAKVTNDGKEGKKIEVNKGDAFVQGIFLPYGIAKDDDADGTRNGGMGSTGK